MRVQLLHNIEHPVAGPQPLVQIDECDPQDILMAGHWHDAAFNISQEFFSAHCSAHGTCGDKEIVVIEEDTDAGWTTGTKSTTTATKTTTTTTSAQTTTTRALRFFIRKLGHSIYRL